jgi:hypothetical protein
MLCTITDFPVDEDRGSISGESLACIRIKMMEAIPARVALHQLDIHHALLDHGLGGSLIIRALFLQSLTLHADRLVTIDG